MLLEQGGQCAICRTPPPNLDGWRLDIDHDHETNQVRGLLCGHCNLMVGYLEKNILNLMAALEYLEQRGEDVRQCRRGLERDGEMR